MLSHPYKFIHMYTSSPIYVHITHPAHIMTNPDKSGHPGAGRKHHEPGQSGHEEHDRQGLDLGMFNRGGGEGSETP